MSRRAALSARSEPESLILVSHALCPYVQRALIVALERGIEVERVVIDLAAKPAWFVERSPTGKVPMLMVGEATLFESAAIAEFLDEISGGGLLPDDALDRARHRAWIEFASGTLAAVGAFYSARDAGDFGTRRETLVARFRRIEQALKGPWFGGEGFGLVDAAFAPIFRYLDAFERHAGLFLPAGLPKLAGWRHRLSGRASVRSAVVPDFPVRLHAFLLARESRLSSLMSQHEATAQACAHIVPPQPVDRSGTAGTPRPISSGANGGAP